VATDPIRRVERGLMLSAAQPTCFLIADISGYTGYLADVELDHAQDILADLIPVSSLSWRRNSRRVTRTAVPSPSWPGPDRMGPWQAFSRW